MAINEYMQLMVEQFSDAIICCSSTGEVETWNKSAEALLGYKESEMIGRSALLTVPARYIAPETDISLRVVAGERVGDYVTARIHASGRIVEVTVAQSVITNFEGEPVGIAFAIRRYTKADRIITQLQRSAFVDPITHTFNRTGLEATLARRNSGPHTGLTGLLFLDLDGFKKVNDVAGHKQGDRVLEECAARMKTCVRSTDSIGRWGGDEFVVVVHDLQTSEHAAAQTVDAICRNLLKALRVPYQSASGKFNCPPSIGAVIYDNFQIVPSQAVELADQAMYLVKKNSKNAYHLYLHRSSRDFDVQRQSSERVAAVA